MKRRLRIEGGLSPVTSVKPYSLASSATTSVYVDGDGNGDIGIGTRQGGHKGERRCMG